MLRWGAHQDIKAKKKEFIFDHVNYLGENTRLSITCLAKVNDAHVDYIGERDIIIDI